MGPCGTEVDSLMGAITLYKSLSRKLGDTTLTKAERRRIVEQRRCLVEVYGAAVRYDPDTLKLSLVIPPSRSMSVPAPDPGALLVLVGEGGKANKTYFIPFNDFSKGERRKVISKNRMAFARVLPGNFDRKVDSGKLADALVALAEKIRKADTL